MPASRPFLYFPHRDAHDGLIGVRSAADDNCCAPPYATRLLCSQDHGSPPLHAPRMLNRWARSSQRSRRAVARLGVGLHPPPGLGKRSTSGIGDRGVVMRRPIYTSAPSTPYRGPPGLSRRRSDEQIERCSPIRAGQESVAQIYERELSKLHEEQVLPQKWIVGTSHKAYVTFEGRDGGEKEGPRSRRSPSTIGRHAAERVQAATTPAGVVIASSVSRPLIGSSCYGESVFVSRAMA